MTSITGRETEAELVDMRAGGARREDAARAHRHRHQDADSAGRCRPPRRSIFRGFPRSRSMSRKNSSSPRAPARGSPKSNALLDRQAARTFAFEPPDLSRLLGSDHAGTLGGMLACNLSGPRRIKAGAARDHILGVAGVSGRGEAFKAGGRVVKNVTGYDLPKLMAGSYGTLAALTAVTFKVLPRAESEETLVLEGLDDADADRAP